MNYHRRLEEQIIARKQGSDESSIDFLTCIQGLYSLYPRPIPLSEQLDRAYGNLRLNLRGAIRRREFNSFNELAALTLDFEQAMSKGKEDIPPPSPEDSFIPEYAYKPKGKAKAGKNNQNSKSAEVAAISELQSSASDTELTKLKEQVSGLISQLSKVEGAPNNSEISQLKAKVAELSKQLKIVGESKSEASNTQASEKSDSPKKKKMTCFKCNKEGHHFNQCKTKRGLVCFGCREPGVIKKDCPKCNPPENKEGGKQAG